MTLEQLTQKFITSPKNMEMGAGKLSARYGCSKSDVYKAREAARKHLHAEEVADLETVIALQEAHIAKYVGSETSDEGVTKKYESVNPLTRKELEELVGADGVTTTISRVWEKQAPNGTWTYSIDVRFAIPNFYSKEELKERLKELFPDVTPFTLPIVSGPPANKALLIILADDHCGMVNTQDMYSAGPYLYPDRLLEISHEAKSLGTTFDEVHVISLGDQMNGWNSQTTRGGHEVKSASNKEQFDIYTEGRVTFYEDLFSSGISENYFVHDIENSNHSGNGMSYMANRYLDMYLEAKFPQVARHSIHTTLDGFQYGQHVIVMGHGKDEKFQKRPMPAVLNAATDLYLYDFIQNKGVSPYTNTVTFYKGDLHQHGVQHGKFGRYVNVQSIAGNSDYGDINFGNTRGGALLEILDRDTYKIVSQPIWF